MPWPFTLPRGLRLHLRTTVSAIVLCLLLARGLWAQGPRLLRDTLPPGDPIQLLLDRGAQLRLTARQTMRLREIQRGLRVANEPLVDQLLTIRHEVGPTRRIPHAAMPPGQRAAFQHGVQRARPLMQGIARNNYEAMQQVGTVLTSRQKVLVRHWLERAPGGPGGTVPHGSGARGRGMGGARALPAPAGGGH